MVLSYRLQTVLIFASMAFTSRVKGILKTQFGLNASGLFALFSLCFCWFFGIPGVVAGYIALKNLTRLKRSRASGQKKTAFKLKWGYLIAWAGTVFSFVFTVLYLIALITGAYIR